MEPAEEQGSVEEKRGIGGAARAGVGKLFLVLAGCCALALVIFVLMPMLLEEPLPPPPPLPQEIVAEVMGGTAETVVPDPEEQAVQALQIPPVTPQGMAEDSGGQPELTEPSPLWAVRGNGDTMPAVFPRGEEPQQRTPEASQGELPPPLSPEEIQAALPEPAPAAEPVQTAGTVASKEMPGSTAPEAVTQATESNDESHHASEEVPSAEAPLPTATERPVGAAPADVREVQALLKELGYDPGPVDGVWGRRTTEAWKVFAREAGGLALALTGMSVGALSGNLLPPQDLEELNELEALWEAEQASADSEPRPPRETASPSEAPPVRRPAGAVWPGNKQLRPPAEGVVIGKTLRGVMGYRMPLVSRQEVPDQVVSGVLIPSHTTFVILKPGYWELTGLTPDDVHLMRDAEARAEAEREAAMLAAQPEPQQAKRGWNPLRLFRRQAPTAER